MNRKSHKTASKGISQSIADGATFLAGIMGLFLIYGGFSLSDSTHDLRALVTDLTSLPGAQTAVPGTRVVFEGKILADTPALAQEFVAYQRTEYKCPQPAPRCSSADVVFESSKQAFQLTTSDGTVQILNDDYVFDPRPAKWAHAERTEQPHSFATGARKIKGLIAGGKIVGIGVIENSEPSIEVRAETVMAGTRADVVSQLKESVSSLDSSQPWFLLAGFLLTGFSGWRIWKIIQTL